MKGCCGRWFLVLAVAAAQTVPALAIDGVFRVSQFGAGNQIWFEAENYDNRDPDDDSHYRVVAVEGAFGPKSQAINRVEAAGGRLRYDFDIGAADGVSGAWYFWGRVINPNNHSDFILVEDDPGDEQIPDFPPYPGGNDPLFDRNDDEVFERNTPEWGWSGGGVDGHTKELRDGENSMFFFHRQGTPAVFWDVFLWTDDPGYVPTDEDYEAADPVGEIGCDPPDTHCSGLTIEGPDDDTAGTYTVTVDAADENDDEILYVMTVDNGVDPPETIRSVGENVLPLFLTAGTWTISVTVHDNLLCEDAADNSCSVGPFEVEEKEGRGSDKPFRVSNYGGAAQIWFEAEDYTERSPDTDEFFPVAPDPNALNGTVLSRASGAGGCVRYDFDISEADGVGGTWYLWVRFINPGNRSDFVLVEGDPGDLEIPSELPYPGGNVPPFDTGDDRVFEETTGDWRWSGGSGRGEGHVKELHDGLNSMFIFHREGNETRPLDVMMWTDSPDYTPTDEDYLNAEILNGTPCQDPADSHCFTLEVEGPTGPDGELRAGFYTVTVEAEDDGDDPLLYLLEATSDDDPPQVRTARSSDNNVLTILLGPGSWTLRVRVDDDPLCDDAAADDTCTHGPLEVLPQIIEPRPRPDTPYRISEFDGALQIWFEAEDYTERAPDDDFYFPIQFMDGAFEELVMSRASGAGGCVRWDFDISAAGGEAGTWYMWGRVINPNNRSDFMLVEGDVDDFEIPDQEPYPGGNVPPFDVADDRVFEQTVADWTWSGGAGRGEGHVKELHDGVNSMFLFHREGDATRPVDVIMWTNSEFYVPTDDHYDEADPGPGPDEPVRPKFHRGDTDGSGTINIADAVSMLGFLFGGGEDTTCKETQDFDNDGAVVITDAVAILSFLFGGGGDPAPPGPVDQPCGVDPDPPGSARDLGCESYTSC